MDASLLSNVTNLLSLLSQVEPQSQNEPTPNAALALARQQVQQQLIEHLCQRLTSAGPQSIPSRPDLQSLTNASSTGCPPPYPINGTSKATSAADTAALMMTVESLRSEMSAMSEELKISRAHRAHLQEAVVILQGKIEELQRAIQQPRTPREADILTGQLNKNDVSERVSSMQSELNQPHFARRFLIEESDGDDELDTGSEYLPQIAKSDIEAPLSVVPTPLGSNESSNTEVKVETTESMAMQLLKKHQAATPTDKPSVAHNTQTSDEKTGAPGVTPPPAYRDLKVVKASSRTTQEEILTGDAAYLNHRPLRTSAELYAFYRELRDIEDKKTGHIPADFWARTMQRCELETVDDPPRGYWENMVIRDTPQRERQFFVKKCLRFLPNLRSFTISDCGEYWPIHLIDTQLSNYIFPSLESAAVLKTTYTADILVAVTRILTSRSPKFLSLTVSRSGARDIDDMERLCKSCHYTLHFV